MMPGALPDLGPTPSLALSLQASFLCHLPVKGLQGLGQTLPPKAPAFSSHYGRLPSALLDALLVAPSWHHPSHPLLCLLPSLEYELLRTSTSPGSFPATPHSSLHVDSTQ